MVTPYSCATAPDFALGAAPASPLSPPIRGIGHLSLLDLGLLMNVLRFYHNYSTENRQHGKVMMFLVKGMSPMFRAAFPPIRVVAISNLLV